MATWKVFRRSSGIFRRSSDGLPTSSDWFPRSSLLSTVSTCANDAVLKTINLCSVDQLSSYRCELDEIQDPNELLQAPFILFWVGVATRQVFRGSSDGLPIASKGLPRCFRLLPMDFRKFMVGVWIHVIVLCVTDLNLCSLVDLFIEFPS